MVYIETIYNNYLLHECSSVHYPCNCAFAHSHWAKIYWGKISFWKLPKRPPSPPHPPPPPRHWAQNDSPEQLIPEAFVLWYGGMVQKPLYGQEDYFSVSQIWSPCPSDHYQKSSTEKSIEFIKNNFHWI